MRECNYSLRALEHRACHPTPKRYRANVSQRLFEHRVLLVLLAQQLRQQVKDVGVLCAFVIKTLPDHAEPDLESERSLRVPPRRKRSGLGNA